METGRPHTAGSARPSRPFTGRLRTFWAHRMILRVGLARTPGGGGVGRDPNGINLQRASTLEALRVLARKESQGQGQGQDQARARQVQRLLAYRSQSQDGPHPNHQQQQQQLKQEEREIQGESSSRHPGAKVGPALGAKPAGPGGGTAAQGVTCTDDCGECGRKVSGSGDTRRGGDPGMGQGLGGLFTASQSSELEMPGVHRSSSSSGSCSSNSDRNSNPDDRSQPHCGPLEAVAGVPGPPPLHPHPHSQPRSQSPSQPHFPPHSISHSPSHFLSHPGSPLSMARPRHLEFSRSSPEHGSPGCTRDGARHAARGGSPARAAVSLRYTGGVSSPGTRGVLSPGCAGGTLSPAGSPLQIVTHSQLHLATVTGAGAREVSGAGAAAEIAAGPRAGAGAGAGAGSEPGTGAGAGTEARTGAGAGLGSEPRAGPGAAGFATRASLRGTARGVASGGSPRACLSVTLVGRQYSTGHPARLAKARRATVTALEPPGTVTHVGSEASHHQGIPQSTSVPQSTGVPESTGVPCGGDTSPPAPARRLELCLTRTRYTKASLRAAQRQLFGDSHINSNSTSNGAGEGFAVADLPLPPPVHPRPQGSAAGTRNSSCAASVGAQSGYNDNCQSYSDNGASNCSHNSNRSKNSNNSNNSNRSHNSNNSHGMLGVPSRTPSEVGARYTWGDWPHRSSASSPGVLAQHQDPSGLGGGEEMHQWQGHREVTTLGVGAIVTGSPRRVTGPGIVTCVSDGSSHTGTAIVTGSPRRVTGPGIVTCVSDGSGSRCGSRYGSGYGSEEEYHTGAARSLASLASRGHTGDGGMSHSETGSVTGEAGECWAQDVGAGREEVEEVEEEGGEREEKGEEEAKREGKEREEGEEREEEEVQMGWPLLALQSVLKELAQETQAPSAPHFQAHPHYAPTALHTGKDADSTSGAAAAPGGGMRGGAAQGGVPMGMGGGSVGMPRVSRWVSVGSYQRGGTVHRWRAMGGPAQDEDTAGGARAEGSGAPRAPPTLGARIRRTRTTAPGSPGAYQAQQGAAGAAMEEARLPTGTPSAAGGGPLIPGLSANSGGVPGASANSGGRFGSLFLGLRKMGLSVVGPIETNRGGWGEGRHRWAPTQEDTDRGQEGYGAATPGGYPSGAPRPRTAGPALRGRLRPLGSAAHLGSVGITAGREGAGWGGGGDAPVHRPRTAGGALTLRDRLRSLTVGPADGDAEAGGSSNLLGRGPVHRGRTAGLPLQGRFRSFSVTASSGGATAASAATAACKGAPEGAVGGKGLDDVSCRGGGEGVHQGFASGMPLSRTLSQPFRWVPSQEGQGGWWGAGDWGVVPGAIGYGTDAENEGDVGEAAEQGFTEERGASRQRAPLPQAAVAGETQTEALAGEAEAEGAQAQGARAEGARAEGSEAEGVLAEEAQAEPELPPVSASSEPELALVPTFSEPGPAPESASSEPGFGTPAMPSKPAGAPATLVVAYGPFPDAGAVARCTMEGRLRKLREMRGELQGLVQDWGALKGSLTPPQEGAGGRKGPLAPPQGGPMVPFSREMRGELQGLVQDWEEGGPLKGSLAPPQGGPMVPFSKTSFSTPRSYDQGLRAPDAGGALTSLVLRMVVGGAASKGRKGGQGEVGVGNSRDTRSGSGSGSERGVTDALLQSHPAQGRYAGGQLQWLRVLFGMRSKNGAVPRALSAVSEAIFPISSVPPQGSTHEPPYMRALPDIEPPAPTHALSSMPPQGSTHEPQFMKALPDSMPLPPSHPSLTLRPRTLPTLMEGGPGDTGDAHSGDPHTGDALCASESLSHSHALPPHLLAPGSLSVACQGLSGEQVHPGYAPRYRALATLPESSPAPRGPPGLPLEYPPPPAGVPLEYPCPPLHRHALDQPRVVHQPTTRGPQSLPLRLRPLDYRLSLPSGPQGPPAPAGSLSGLGMPQAHPWGQGQGRGPGVRALGQFGYESDRAEHERRHRQYGTYTQYTQYKEYEGFKQAQQYRPTPPRAYTVSATAGESWYQRHTAGVPLAPPGRHLRKLCPLPLPLAPGEGQRCAPGMPSRSYTESAAMAGAWHTPGMPSQPPARALLPSWGGPSAAGQQYHAPGMPPRSSTVSAADGVCWHSAGAPFEPHTVKPPSWTGSATGSEQQGRAPGMPPRSHTVCALAAAGGDGSLHWYTAGAPSQSRAVPRPRHTPSLGVSALGTEKGHWYIAGAPSQAVPFPRPRPSWSIYALGMERGQSPGVSLTHGEGEGGAPSSLGLPAGHPQWGEGPLSRRGAQGTAEGSGVPEATRTCGGGCKGRGGQGGGGVAHPPACDADACSGGSGVADEGAVVVCDGVYRTATEVSGNLCEKDQCAATKRERCAATEQDEDSGDGAVGEEGEQGTGGVVLSATAPSGTLSAVYQGRTVCTFAPGLEQYVEHTGDEALDAHMDRVIGVISEYYHSSYC